MGTAEDAFFRKRDRARAEQARQFPAIQRENEARRRAELAKKAGINSELDREVRAALARLETKDYPGAEIEEWRGRFGRPKHGLVFWKLYDYHFHGGYYRGDSITTTIRVHLRSDGAIVQVRENDMPRFGPSSPSPVTDASPIAAADLSQEIRQIVINKLRSL